MFEFTETILIEAPSSVVWDTMYDLENWWPASNPEHQSLERLDDRDIEPGARLRIREKIAGVPGEAIGEITRVEPGTEVTWHAPAAVLRRRTGRTLLEWITERRMTEVRRMLRETDLSLDAVAARTGLRDATYLVRRFRDRHGITPHRWRHTERVRL